MQALSQPLTERDGVSLREEVRDLSAVDGDRPVRWGSAVRRWRSYIEDTEDVETVMQNKNTGEKACTSKPHRFHPEYADKQYAKLKDLERGISADYGKRLHTAMLTLTASAAPDGDQLPPVDHLDGLLESWSAVRRALNRALDGHRFERLAILEPHGGEGTNHGYLHVHIAVFVDGKVSKGDLAPVIRSHVRNCDLAGEDAHDVTDDSTISIRHAGADRDLDDDDALDELAIYLAEYLGTYGEDDPLDAPEHVQASNALLWSTGRRRWRPSDGAQQYMKHEPDEEEDAEEPSEWELIGIEKDGEFLPAEAGESGGVTTFTTGPVDSSDPPPSGTA